MKVKPGDAQLSSASQLGNNQSILCLIVRHLLDYCVEWPDKMLQEFAKKSGFSKRQVVCMSKVQGEELSSSLVLFKADSFNAASKMGT